MLSTRVSRTASAVSISCLPLSPSPTAEENTPLPVCMKTPMGVAVHAAGAMAMRSVRLRRRHRRWSDWSGWRRGGDVMVSRRCRVLVIEDNEQVSALLDQVISLEGYAVEVVRPPLDDTASLVLADYDVALIDLSLPYG